MTRKPISSRTSSRQIVIEFGRSEETMKYEHILVEREDGAGIVTLNRPEKLNAMSRKLSSELRDAVKELEAEDAIACIVITGAGNRAFPPAATSTSSARTTAASPGRIGCASRPRQL
jgi:1,4-dihydroxy-2-naphthoyl-CoA synthase